MLTAVGTITIIALTAQDQGKLSGAWSLLLRQAFGVGAYPVAILLLAGGIVLLLWDPLKKRFAPRWRSIIGCELFFFAGLGLLHTTASAPSLDLARTGTHGGYVGWALGQLMVPLLGRTLSITLLVTAVLSGTYLAIGIPWRFLSWRIRWIWAQSAMRIRAAILARQHSVAPVMARPAPEQKPPPAKRPARAKPRSTSPKPKATKRKKPAPQPARGTKTRTVRASMKLPPLDLLIPDEADLGDDADARHQAQIIEETLEAFGIPAQVVEWNRGPVVTQFGVEPGYVERQDRDGNSRRYKIRVSKILSLTNDLALALAATPIRIEAPVPGRPVVGIEVPNAAKALVGLRGVLESTQFRKIRTKLRIALGRDVSGAAVVADLGMMPHLLLAGATGSGKSVCLNAIIASLLFQNTPNELKLLMVDPKRVELTKYNGIPHLIAPVVVDIEKVIVALRWTMREMDQRYKQLAKLEARDIKVYNKKAKAKGLDTLPVIVIIIDELADLMLAASDDVERTICRLAQMARATGIHLVIATQRPSVDVVTGLIKANFAARISFAVSSQIDSRVILDTPGAEKLLGRGDMLFMAPDSPKLRRIQGCFVSDKELDALVSFWRAKVTASHRGSAEPSPWEGLSFERDASDDVLLQQTIEMVRQHKQASASFLQRHLRIGYPRAARLIDQLEALGVVGPPEKGGRSRVVLPSGETAAEDTTSSVAEENTA